MCVFYTSIKNHQFLLLLLIRLKKFLYNVCILYEIHVYNYMKYMYITI